MVVSPGNAIGVDFYNPKGNRVEVYWATGLAAHQSYLEAVDLDQAPDVVFRRMGGLRRHTCGQQLRRFPVPRRAGPRPLGRRSGAATAGRARMLFPEPAGLAGSGPAPPPRDAPPI
jgi:hypothetical protein